MNKLIVGLGVFFLSSSAVLADSPPPNVVKVTKENNPNCIEYISYKGAMYCSTVALDKTPSIAPQMLGYEKQNIKFDDRAWKAAWGEHKEYITSIEYLPAGDDINHWSELVTSQFMPGLEALSAQEFVNRFIANLKKSGVVFSSKILESNKNMVLFEFQVKNPQNLEQDELQKVVKGKDGLYALHYAIKKSDMGAANRAKWVKNLKESTLKP